MQLTVVGLILLAGLFLQGCAKQVVVPNVMTAAGGEMQAERAIANWETVLSEYVDADGKINFAALAENPHRLENYVRFIANVSPQNHPEQFRGKGEALAYYLNSYNALAMYGVVHLKVDEGFESLWARADFFKLHQHLVGERWLSLVDYENDVIRPLGDARVHFALNCMVRGCPRLPQTPFRAATLEQQLENAAAEFLNDPRNVRVDREAKSVHLSEILKFYTEDFVNPETASTLIDYVNRYHRPKVPDDYAIEFIPYDWTLNKI